MSCPGREALDACAAGQLAPERATTVEAHAAQCDGCGRRLAWLRCEDEAIRSWAANSSEEIEPLWAGIEARIQRRPARRRLAWAAMSAAAAVAAAIVLIANPKGDGEEETPSAAAAVARAEEDYARAVASLEARIAVQHSPAGRRNEAALGRARSRLSSARASAGTGSAARARVLEGYAAYLKSLRRALQDDGP